MCLLIHAGIKVEPYCWKNRAPDHQYECNSLLPESTQSFLESMLTNYQLCPVTYFWGQFPQNTLQPPITGVSLKITYLKISLKSTRSQWGNVFSFKNKWVPCPCWGQWIIKQLTARMKVFFTCQPVWCSNQNIWKLSHHCGGWCPGSLCYQVLSNYGFKIPVQFQFSQVIEKANLSLNIFFKCIQNDKA